jgi:hypothetical protein
MPNNEIDSTNQPSTTIPRFRDAYDRLSVEIKAVEHDDLVPINVDVPTAITTVLGAMPEINALRPRIEKELPAFDLGRFDKMEDYTLAIGHAQAMYLAASAPSEQLPELAEQAMKTRDQLLSDATALSNRGFVDGKKLGELKGGNGYRNIAFDVFALVAMLREKWSVVQSKTALSAAELDSAEQLADRVITAVGQREQAPAVIGAAADNRVRAFTLFVTAYDQIRRAVSFLRWREGDADTIAPSLYAGRGSRKKSTDEQPSTPAPAPAPAPTTPVAPAPAVDGAPVGLPGSNPFVNS